MAVEALGCDGGNYDTMVEWYTLGFLLFELTGWKQRTTVADVHLDPRPLFRLLSVVPAGALPENEDRLHQAG